MGNSFAYAVLLCWPLFGIYFFRRFAINIAILNTIVIGYMFLPVGLSIKIPSFPDLSKSSLSILTILFCLKVLKKQTIGFFKLKGISIVLMVMLLTAPFLTALTNTEPTEFNPALRLYDGMSMMITTILTIIIPFLLGRQYFSNKESQILLIRYAATAALVYSLFVIFEIRFSPQLHKFFYGYFPHSWLQQSRGGGFRSVAFMGHGLWVAFFIMVGTVSAIALMNAKLALKYIKLPLTWAVLFLFVVLILQKSLASLIYAMLAFITVKLFSPNLRSKAVMIGALIVLMYPLLSILGQFPHKTIEDFAYSYSEQRGQSLNFRFENEKILLSRAYEKPLFGWGKWGRNHVHDDYTGETISVTDGKWIILFGVSGWYGMIAEFGLLILALFMANKAINERLLSKNEKEFLSIHIIIVGIILLDQIPNASLNIFYWVIIGSLFGVAEQIRKNKSIK